MIEQAQTVVPLSKTKNRLAANTMLQYAANVSAHLGEGRFQVSSAIGEEAIATCAASCWLLPEVGDQVLVASVADFNYILAVLKVQSAAMRQVILPDQVEIRSRECIFQSELSLTFKSDHLSQQARLQESMSEEFLMSGQKGVIAAQNLTLVGRVTKLISRACHWTVATLDLLVKKDYRLQARHIHEKAMQIKVAEAKQSLQRGEQVAINAKKVFINS